MNTTERRLYMSGIDCIDHGENGLAYLADKVGVEAPKSKAQSVQMQKPAAAAPNSLPAGVGKRVDVRA